LVDSKKGRSVGDPFVIAVARAKTFTVISGENATRKLEAPRIPDVCDDLGIRWIRMLDFFREQKVVLGVLTVIGWTVFLSASGLL